MIKDFDGTAALERERAYYPKIKELIDLLNRTLPLLHRQANPGDQLVPQQIVINRCLRRSEPASVQIFLDYSVSFLSASSVCSEINGRTELHLQREYSSHQVIYSFYPRTDEIGQVESGNIGLMDLITTVFHQWKSRGMLISPRHGIECDSEVEQEIFWVDIDDYLSMQKL